MRLRTVDMAESLDHRCGDSIGVAPISRSPNSLCLGALRFYYHEIRHFAHGNRMQLEGPQEIPMISDLSGNA